MNGNSTLSFITLTTGDVQETSRREVTDQALTYSSHLLEQALENVPVKLFSEPEDPLLLEAEADGPALWARIFASNGSGQLPLVTLGVLARDPDKTALWRNLHQASAGMPLPIVTDPQWPPKAPWLGARVEPTAALCFDALPMLADFERCLAWAWLAKCGIGYQPEAG